LRYHVDGEGFDATCTCVGFALRQPIVLNAFGLQLDLVLSLLLEIKDGFELLYGVTMMLEERFLFDHKLKAFEQAASLSAAEKVVTFELQHPHFVVRRRRVFTDFLQKTHDLLIFCQAVIDLSKT